MATILVILVLVHDYFGHIKCSSFFDSNLGSSLSWLLYLALGYDVITTSVVELPQSALGALVFHGANGVPQRNAKFNSI